MSAFTYEQSAEILARHHRGRRASCPLCGGMICFEDASTAQGKAVRFECEGCGALGDSHHRQPDAVDES